MKKILITLVVGCAAVCRAGYVDEVTADAPEAMYRFNESVGATTLSDATGNEHGSLSVSNVTFGATGPVDSAAVFSNGLVELDLQIDPSAGDFSVETLIRFDASGNVLQQLDGSGTGRAMLYRLSDGTIGSYLGGENIASSTLIATGEWHHVVMTVEEAGTSDVISFYIDGQSAGSGTTDVEAADGNWRIGKGNLIGAIDELAVYDSLLSAEQVMDHYSWVTAGGEDAGDLPVHYVSRTGTAVYPYTNWATAARYIQQAVNAAAAGDTVLVTNGTYASGAAIVVSDAITLASINGPEVTVVNGQGDHRCLNLNNVGCTLSGFTVTKGAASYSGGGVYCTGINPLITNCIITANSAGTLGGGSYKGTLVDCSINGNTVGDGDNQSSGGGSYGGILTRCSVIGNWISSSSYYGQGGGCYGATLNDCTIADNFSRNSFGDGGGSYNCTLNYCTLSGNQASRNGAGAYGGTLTHCTVTANRGYACYGSTLKNCIVWLNSSAPSGCTISYSCCQGGASGTGNISIDPCFSDLSGHLLASSPCIDAADTGSIFAEDADGVPASLDGDGDGVALPDMGAYEFAGLKGDTDADGLSDAAEVYTYFTDPADSDSDGDGRADGDEVSAGTNPNSDESGIINSIAADPEIYGLYSSDSISGLSQGGAMLQSYNGCVCIQLQLQSCTNLCDAVWTNADDSVLMQIEALEGKEFYRVKGSR